MSLDVSLYQRGKAVIKASSGIFVRENGGTKEITEQEWIARYPDREPVRMQPQTEESEEVYSANITHNLNTMAEQAALYKPLWYPDELKVKYAKELIEPLTNGLKKLKANPEHFKTFNPDNGWGNYEGLVNFTEKYLNACIEYPDAEVSFSR